MVEMGVIAACDRLCDPRPTRLGLTAGASVQTHSNDSLQQKMFMNINSLSAEARSFEAPLQ
jgi:hypothetical protein